MQKMFVIHYYINNQILVLFTFGLNWVFCGFHGNGRHFKISKSQNLIEMLYGMCITCHTTFLILTVYWSPLPWYFYPLIHSIPNPLPMVYRTPYLWYIEHPSHGILNTLSMLYWTSYQCYFTLLPMEYRPPYQWYYQPPIHGISDPLPMVFCSSLPMVYWTLTHGTSNPLPMVYRTPY